MVVVTFPFKYYSVLPDFTLTTKIREESWNLDRLFPLLKTTKAELKKSSHSIQSNIAELPKLQHSVALLATEIKTGIRDLKFINFYDSALLYLYFKLLHHLFEICRREHERLMAERKNATEAEKKLNGQKLANISGVKRELKKRIRKCKGMIRAMEIEERKLVNVSAHLLKNLRNLRWKAEKQAQHEFYLARLTFRNLENLNRKIKVEAMKVKKDVIFQKNRLLARTQQHVDSKDIHELAKLVSEAIDRISKDVSYSSKLISELEDELKTAKKIVAGLKKALDRLIKGKKISEEQAKNIIKPFDDAIKYAEEEIGEDLMQIFRNMFVLYKHAGKRLAA